MTSWTRSRRNSSTSLSSRRARPMLEALERRDVLSTYYVDAAYLGGNNDGSAAHPFTTIQPAANLVQAGDTVLVAPGSYPGFSVHDKAGAPGNRIHFLGTQGPSGEYLTKIDANLGTATNYDGINVQRSKHLEIAGFEIIGTGQSDRVNEGPGWKPTRAGIGIHHYGWADGATWVNGHYKPGVNFQDFYIHHNKIHDFGNWQVFCGSSDHVEVAYNELYGSRVEHGVYVSNSTTGTWIHNNLVHDNGSSGIQINARDENEFVPPPYGGVATNARIENNVIFHNGIGWAAHINQYPGGGGAINTEGNRGTIIRNNLLYGNKASGIVLWTGDGITHGDSFNFVTNNTVIQPKTGRAALLINADENLSWEPAVKPYSKVLGNTIVNNIFWHTFVDANGDGTGDDGGGWQSVHMAVYVTGGTNFSRVTGNILDYNIVSGLMRLSDTEAYPQGTTSFLNFSGWQSAVASQGWDTHSLGLNTTQMESLFQNVTRAAFDDDTDPFDATQATRFRLSPTSLAKDMGIASVSNAYALATTASMLANDPTVHPATNAVPFNQFSPLPPFLAPWPSWTVPTVWTAPNVDLEGNARPAGAGLDIGAFEAGSSPVQQPGLLQFASATANLAEGAGVVSLLVQRQAGSNGVVTVSYATANGTALSGSDFTGTSGILTFANGETSKTITIPILEDSLVEGNESFTVTLSAPGGGATLGNPTTSTVTILDNDALPNQTVFYVRANTPAGGNGSLASPFQTMTQAFNAATASKDYTILVAAGTYSENIGSMTDLYGVNRTYTFLGGYDPGFTTRSGISAVIAASSLQPVFSFFNAQGVTIDGFDISGGRSGIQATGWSSGRTVTILNNHIHHNGTWSTHADYSGVMGGGRSEDFGNHNGGQWESRRAQHRL